MHDYILATPRKICVIVLNIHIADIVFSSEPAAGNEDDDEATHVDDIEVDRSVVNTLKQQINKPGSICERSMNKLMDMAEHFFDEEEVEEQKSSRKQTRMPHSRVKWTTQEEAEIKDLIKFTEDKPTAGEIRRAQKRSARKGGNLHKRSFSSLKNKVLRMWDVGLAK